MTVSVTSFFDFFFRRLFGILRNFTRVNLCQNTKPDEIVQPNYNPNFC